MIKNLWTSFSLPIIVTGIGLLFAVGLGVAPLIKADAQRPVSTPAPVSVESDPGPSGGMSGFEAIQAQLATQEGALDSIGNRLTTLEKGITRINQRVTGQGGRLDAMGDVVRLTNEVAILNKAVPRMNIRLAQQADFTEGLDDMARQIAVLEGQMRILNAAVPRLQALSLIHI